MDPLSGDSGASSLLWACPGEGSAVAGPPGTTTSTALGGTTLDWGCSNATS